MCALFILLLKVLLYLCFEKHRRKQRHCMSHGLQDRRRDGIKVVTMYEIAYHEQVAKVFIYLFMMIQIPDNRHTGRSQKQRTCIRIGRNWNVLEIEV